MTEKMKNITKEEWRKLGFYYDRDDPNKKWVLVGSKTGMEDFCTILDRYTGNNRNARMGEHDHFGPYQYLTIRTGKVFNITSDCICGSLEDLKILSAIIKVEIKNTKDEELPVIKLLNDNLLKKNDYMIQINFMEYGYDPASADTQLWS